MLDIKWIRENQEAFVKGLTDRGFEQEPRELLAQILSLDAQRRETIQKLQELQARRVRHAARVPRWVHDQLDMALADTRDGANLHFGVVLQDVAHAAAGGRQRHLARHELRARR